MTSRTRFPPEPNAASETKLAIATQFGAEPPIIVKAALISKDVLNESRRPMMSDRNPQNRAPTKRPIYRAIVRELCTA